MCPALPVTNPWQVVTQMSSVYRTRSPPPYQKLLQVIESLVNWIPYLDLKVWLGWDNSLEARLLLVALLPPAALLISLLCDFIWHFVHEWRIASIRDTHYLVHEAFDKAFFTILPPTVFITFFVSIPIASFGFLAVRECDCFWLLDPAGERNGTFCVNPIDYTLLCPATAGNATFRENATWWHSPRDDPNGCQCQ